jgi:hypothetical protein
MIVPAATEVGGTAGAGARLGVTVRIPTAGGGAATSCYFDVGPTAPLVQTLIDQPIPHR